MDENKENFEIFKEWIDDLIMDLNRATNNLIHQENYPKAAYELGYILGRLKAIADSMESESDDEEDEESDYEEIKLPKNVREYYEKYLMGKKDCEKKCQSRCS